VHYNGLLPSLDPGDQTIISMMTYAPLTFPEDLKLLLKEGLAKLCLQGIVPREYETLQFCLSSGEPDTRGHYLLSGLSTLLGHICASGMYCCFNQTSSRSPRQMSTHGTSPPYMLPLRRKSWIPQGTNARQEKWPPTLRAVSAQSPNKAERQNN
jgi:hypothetical protein